MIDYDTEQHAIDAILAMGFRAFPQAWGPAWEGGYVAHDGRQASVSCQRRCNCHAKRVVRPHPHIEPLYHVEISAAGDLEESTVARIFSEREG